MADLLIKNIPMPKFRTFKIEVYPNGACIVDNGGIIPISATAQELPPHGRLGDLDALEESLEASDEDIYTKHILWDAPTIIEAST